MDRSAHAAQREALSPAFRRDAVDALASIFATSAQRLTDALAERPGEAHARCHMTAAVAVAKGRAAAVRLPPSARCRHVV